MISENLFMDFMFNNHSPIRTKVTLEAIENLLSYNITNIVPILDEVVMDSNTDTTMKIATIRSEITYGIKEVINEIGVVPYQNVSDFLVISKVLGTLDRLVNDYLPDYVLENSELDKDDVPDLEKLLSLIKLIYGINEDDYYEAIYSIDSQVLVNLRKLLQSKVIPEFETNDVEILARYKEFVNGKATGVVFEYITNDGIIGQVDLGTMLDLMSAPILSLLPTERPFDILSALLITSASIKDVKEAIPEWAKYFSDSDAEEVLISKELTRLAETIK